MSQKIIIFSFVISCTLAMKMPASDKCFKYIPSEYRSNPSSDDINEAHGLLQEQHYNDGLLGKADINEQPPMYSHNCWIHPSHLSRSIFQQAIFDDKLEDVKVLMKLETQKPDLFCKTSPNELNILALAKSAEMANFLLGQLNVDRERVVNGTDKGGFTALHKAAMYGNIKLCRALIDGGADAFARETHSPVYERFNPLQLALDKYNEECKYDEDEDEECEEKFKLQETIKYLRSHMKSELGKKSAKKGKRKRDE